MIFHRLLMSGGGKGIFLPVIIDPEENGLTLFEFDKIIGSDFEESGGTDFHRGTQWQIATDEDFTNIVNDTGMLNSNLTDINVGDLGTSMLETYYVRVKYYAVTDVSEWSEPISFNTNLFEQPLTDWADDIFGALTFGF